MAEYPTIRAMFRTIADEYKALSNPAVDSFIEIALDRLSGEAVWGGVYTQAAAFLAAHIMKQLRVGEDLGLGDTAVSGPVTSRKAGDLAESYGKAAIKHANAHDEELSQTAYGRQFLSLRTTRAATLPRAVSVY